MERLVKSATYNTLLMGSREGAAAPNAGQF